MPQANIFTWRTGNGWLVLSGGGSWDSEHAIQIEAKLLGLTLSQGPLAYVWAASDIETADRHMDALRDLGARTGYLVDVLAEEDDALFHQLSEAGVIILGDGSRVGVLREALGGVVLRGLVEAFDQGATIYAVGQSAALLGTFVLSGDELVPGCNWLARSIIMPGYTDEKAGLLRGCVVKYADGYGLGLGTGAALALGPGGEIEVWGNPAITVSLGRSYDPGLSHQEEK